MIPSNSNHNEVAVDIQQLDNSNSSPSSSVVQTNPMSRPTYRPSNPPKSIILFDGICNVCDGFIHFVYPRDTQKRFSYQALQSVKGGEILDYYGIPKDLSTIVLIEEESNTHYTKSTAVLRVLYYLKNPYPLMYTFYYLPRFFRDFCYGTFANYRYLIMGKKDVCGFNPGLKDRFIDFRSPIIDDDTPDETKEM
ncbi:hypothetical protein SAMD00019534_070900 [Acytostelium subglobosum LB1]|uniref:hypothetical protein n=1 Tax=Acytostelium subglobosum LB1 TaxID=1410327 RepID=UPI000644A334|nr:hypothetical protein SAMD00019534_070900 [Acytostelium subglobosum LB1]GAM23915.1 hypothetical protein SAMD00019534_070900 [Acytostelium subglobosum LB1]|eukprot:XP_012752951.1 hypothetical protein SAMD00019534_070900 [Acytostelium subglobosum LB1]